MDAKDLNSGPNAFKQAPDPVSHLFKLFSFEAKETDDQSRLLTYWNIIS